MFPVSTWSSWYNKPWDSDSASAWLKRCVGCCFGPTGPTSSQRMMQHRTLNLKTEWRSKSKRPCIRDSSSLLHYLLGILLSMWIWILVCKTAVWILILDIMKANLRLCEIQLDSLKQIWWSSDGAFEGRWLSNSWTWRSSSEFFLNAGIPRLWLFFEKHYFKCNI